MIETGASMARRIVLAFLLIFAAQAASTASSATEPAMPFGQWLEGVRRDAEARGIAPQFLDVALAGVTPIRRVIELDRRQPEFTLTFWAYLDRAVNDARVRRGRAMMARHAKALDAAYRRYGVHPRFIVAFWGLESNFGEHTGAFPVVGAVATLAHDVRRSRFFRAQLMAALTIMSRGDVAVDVKGSWAGAMGNFQFIPTTYLQYAVDGDGDGRRDMWHSFDDMFFSAANYLARSGWRRGWTWGREVRLPKDFSLSSAGLDVHKTLGQWRALGVTRIDGGALPDEEDANASVVLPAGVSGPAFLVYRNYRTILVWNRSLLYAIAVGHLADRLVGGGPFRSPRPAAEVPLSRADVIDLQRRLAANGFATGGADGVIGPQTRNAIKAYQRAIQLPPDGYPTIGLLERLRAGGR